MNNSKTLLVVGGTGVISFAVVNEALKQGYKVTCINRGKSKNQKLDKSVEVLISDYRNRSNIESLIKDRYFNTILDVLVYTPEDVEYSVSLFGNHCNQYIFFSSAEAYNKPKYKESYYNEDAELINPLWSYSINKAKSEEKLIRLSQNYKFKYTIIRPAITYGNTRIPYAIMPDYGFHGTIIQRILNKKPIVLFDGGNNVATFLRVEDFAMGLVGLIANEKAYNQAFHISGDEVTTWKHILDITGEILGIQPIYFNVTSETLANEMPDYSQQIIGGRSINQRLDNSKIKNAVNGFKTNIHLREGIESTLNYYKDHNYLSGIDWKFEAEFDRIVKKYAENSKIYNTNFTDYFNDASLEDKVSYWLYKHRDNICCNFIVKLNVIIKKIKNKFL